MIEKAYQNYTAFVEKVETNYGAVPAFAVKTAMTGVIYGVVVAALAALAKAFASICARVGYTTFAARIALPALLTNPWFVLAISVAVPALSLLIQALKTKKTEEIKEEDKMPSLNPMETKAYKAITGRVDMGYFDCCLVDFYPKTTDKYENFKNIKDEILDKYLNLDKTNTNAIVKALNWNYQDNVFCLRYNLHSDSWHCTWVRKELTEREKKEFKQVENAMKLKIGDSTVINSDGVAQDVLYTHLHAKYPDLTFDITESKGGQPKVSWHKTK
jgi:hypothetical protein